MITKRFTECRRHVGWSSTKQPPKGGAYYVIVKIARIG